MLSTGIIMSTQIPKDKQREGHAYGLDARKWPLISHHRGVPYANWVCLLGASGLDNRCFDSSGFDREPWKPEDQALSDLQKRVQWTSPNLCTCSEYRDGKNPFHFLGDDHHELHTCDCCLHLPNDGRQWTTTVIAGKGYKMVYGHLNPHYNESEALKDKVKRDSQAAFLASLGD